MFKLVTVARTSIIEIFPIEYDHNDAPWQEVQGRLLDNVYDVENNFIVLLTVDERDSSLYYMEIDAIKAPNDFQQILKSGIEIMKAYLHDYGFGMRITENYI